MEKTCNICGSNQKVNELTLEALVTVEMIKTPQGFYTRTDSGIVNQPLSIRVCEGCYAPAKSMEVAWMEKTLSECQQKT